MSKKKIAFFGIKYFPSKGGSSRIAESIAKELQQKYEITIYCFKHPDAKSHLAHVKTVEIPQIRLGEVGVFLYYLLCCLHILFFGKYDLIHAHKTDSAIFIPILRLRNKVIATSQEAPYLRDKWNFLGKAYLRLMEYFFIYTSSLRTSVSKPLSKVYEKRYDKEVHYIPNGVALHDVKKNIAIDGLLGEYGVGEDEEYIFFAARRIMYTKGCHTFLEAMRQVNYTGKILIAGENSHAKSYMKTLSDLAEGLDVTFMGYIDNKETLMGLVDHAKWFVFPSLTEGLSLMLLEVGCRGTTPILCSDIPENTEVFSKDEVLYFKANNSDDMAEKFAWGMTNFEQIQKMTRLAKERVFNEYSSQVVAGKYDQLYSRFI